MSTSASAALHSGRPARLTHAERRRAAGLAAVVVSLHAVGFVILFALLLPHGNALGTGSAVGVAMTAYLLGVRHAFDPDHLAAIDGTTRKLMADGGQRPLGVGFFFSLGHSSVVLVLTLLVGLGVGGLGGAVRDDGSALHQFAAVFGPIFVSGFLVVVGLLNLAILRSILHNAREARREGRAHPQPGARSAVVGGPMTRIFGRATGLVRMSWQMYPVGLLFGLGFDTATEVSLLVLTGGAAASGLPFYAILCLPLLFAAGMSLFDTLDGVLMTFAYEWAAAKPARGVSLNVALTGLSGVLALLIGGFQLAL